MAQQPHTSATAFLDSWEQRVSEWAHKGESTIFAATPPFDRTDAPRPLMLHLMLAAASAVRATGDAAGISPDLAEWLAAPTVLPAPKTGEINSQFGLEVGIAALEKIRLMLDGIQAYRQHPWRRPPATHDVVWQRGSSRMLDYSPRRRGRPLLVIPSLVNRATVLDLLPERSLLNWLAEQGHRPLLLDWGTPGVAEMDFGVDDYLLERLLPAADLVAEDGPPDVLGYCMGGIFAVALANLRPVACHRMALLASPWDFFTAKGAAGCLREFTRTYGVAQFEELLQLIGQSTGGLPVEFLQGIFALLDPNLVVRKFSKFAVMDQISMAATVFVATEDWLNDSTPLTTCTARDVLVRWCLENSLAYDQWQVDNTVIQPESVRHPTLVISSGTDRIAPPASVAILADRIPKAHHMEISAGHVGMMVGSTAAQVLWEPLHAWLTESISPQKPRRQRAARKRKP